MIEYRFILVQILIQNNFKIQNFKICLSTLEYLLVGDYRNPKEFVPTKYA